MRNLQTQTAVVTVAEQQLNHVATLFIQKANSFRSRITVTQGVNSVNAKSLLGLLSLQLKEGSQVTLTAEGPDEAEAVDVLIHMLAQN